MRERVTRAGGAFNIESQPGKGTAITATVPVGDPADAEPVSAG